MPRKNILNGLNAGSFLIDRGLAQAPESKMTRGSAIVNRNRQLLSNIVLDMLGYSRDRLKVTA